jgi:hypothetical protein
VSRVYLKKRFLYIFVTLDQVAKAKSFCFNVGKESRVDYKAVIIGKRVCGVGMDLASVHDDKIARLGPERLSARDKLAPTLKKKQKLYMLVPMGDKRGATCEMAKAKGKVVLFGRYGFVK